MSHGLVEPLQEDDERTVGLFLHSCSDLSGHCQGSQADQSPADCRFSVDLLVGERREIHDGLPLDPIPRFGWSRAPIAARREG